MGIGTILRKPRYCWLGTGKAKRKRWKTMIERATWRPCASVPFCQQHKNRSMRYLRRRGAFARRTRIIILEWKKSGQQLHERICYEQACILAVRWRWEPFCRAPSVRWGDEWLGRSRRWSPVKTLSIRTLFEARDQIISQWLIRGNWQ